MEPIFFINGFSHHCLDQIPEKCSSRRVCLGSQLEVQSTMEVRKGHRTRAHAMSVVRKQGMVKPAAQLTSSFLVSQDPSPWDAAAHVSAGSSLLLNPV